MKRMELNVVERSGIEHRMYTCKARENFLLWYCLKCRETNEMKHYITFWNETERCTSTK